MLQLGGLSDLEIKELCRKPTRDKRKIFGRADALLRRCRKQFELVYPNEWLCINAKTLFYTLGKTQDEAQNQHYGPVGRDGMHLITVYLTTKPPLV